MSFANNEKVDIRRYCGYMQFGSGPGGFEGWRFFQAYGLLEYRMDNMAPEEEAVVRTVYLSNLYDLENAILGTSDNLDTDKAAVWTHNKDELRDRDNLFNNWRRKLCFFIGVPPGEALQAQSGMRLVI